MGIDLFKCKIENCSNFIHASCFDGESGVCPAHKCAKCEQDLLPHHKIARCLKCPKAFHYDQEMEMEHATQIVEQKLLAEKKQAINLIKDEIRKCQQAYINT